MLEFILGRVMFGNSHIDVRVPLWSVVDGV